MNRGLGASEAADEARPRNRRTATGSGTGNASSSLPRDIRSRASTPGSSRAVSPVGGGSKRNSGSGRPSSRRGGGAGGTAAGTLAPEPPWRGTERSRSPAPFAGLFDAGWAASSWSAIQGLASSVLGGEYSEDEAASGMNGARRMKMEAERRRGRGRDGSKTTPATWGPSGLPKKPEDVIGAGSAAERTAAVRAMKMRGVLEGREDDLNARRDTNGNYKRRTSLEESTGSLRDDEGDALVYLHKVQPQDTLAGVVLRYNCQPAVFRKANRLWPNDSIQIRKVVVLPVDACTIKGRPCEGPQSPKLPVDHLMPTEREDAHTLNNGSTWPGAASSTQSVTSTDQPEGEEHPWTHVRWVQFDSFPSATPVEIARMPRQTLGYFPPRRRRSQATISTVSSPRGSSDLPAFSLPSNDPSGGSPSSSTASRRASNIPHRPSPPVPGSYFPPPSGPVMRPRGESVGEVAERLGWMRGPGGVGTFSKNVRRPGPAQDGLNSWAKKHIPGLAIDSLPSASLPAGESAHISIADEVGGLEDGQLRAMRSGTATPSGAGQGLGLENAAAAIEGWVRRLGTIRPGTPRMGGLGGSEPGADLIELLDGTGSDDGRGFELSPGTSRVPTLGSTGREDLDGIARGRSTAGSKGGKGD